MSNERDYREARLRAIEEDREIFDRIRPEPKRVMKLGFAGWAVILFAVGATVAVFTVRETVETVLIWGFGLPLFIALCVFMGVQIVRGLYEFARDFVSWLRRSRAQR